MSVWTRKASGKWSVGLVLGLATGLLLSSVGRADVLQYAPTDALGVFQIKNVGATNKKASSLFTKLGVAAMKPELADPLAALKAELGVKDGINEAGEFGFILLPAGLWPKEEAGMADYKPALVMLIPVSDYKAFIANFADAKTDGDVTEMTKNGVTSYVSKWGEFAAIAPKKEFLGAKGGGLKLNAAAVKEFATKDAVLWANIPAMKSVFAPKIAEAREKGIEKITEEMKAKPETEKYIPVAKAAVGQLINAAEAFLATSQGATVSLDLSDAGLNYAVATEFAPESYLGKLVTAIKGADTSYTAGLPAAPYIFYGGTAVDGNTTVGLVNDLAGPIVKSLNEVDPENGADVQKTLDALTGAMKSTKSTTFGWIAPRGAIGTESLIQMTYCVKGNAKEYKAAMAQYGQSYSKMFTKMMPNGGAISVDFKGDAKTVDGVVFDTIVTGPNKNPKPEDAQAAQAITFMYGPGGLTYATGAVDETTAVMAMGLPDATLSKAIAAAKAGDDSLGKLPTVAATAKALPEKPVMEMYFALDELVRTGIIYARQFGMPVNVQLPDALPPIGIAVETSANTVRVDTHVPTELVQSLVAAFIQVQMQMGGGPGGGGNGGF